MILDLANPATERDHAQVLKIRSGVVLPVDLPEIEHLDFHEHDRRCYAHHGHCGRTAAWSVRLCCLGCGREVHVLFCDEHKREIVRLCRRRRGAWRDKACTTGARIRLYSVTRIPSGDAEK